MMGEQNTINSSNVRRPGLLRDQVQLVKRKDGERYEIVPIPDQLSFEKGFFIVIRACQLLTQKNDGIILVGVAGPSGAGKTVFTEKVLNFMPSIAIISMDNYNDSTRIIDGNFDDPRLTDYETLLHNIRDLKEGKSVQVPVYDYKLSCRTGYRTVEVPTSRVVFIEGIYALSEKLRPFLDLRVSITGGVHFDLVKRVLRDIQRAGQEPEEIIHQISETVYPMYKAFIEPDLQTAHIKIVNKFNPFSGFQSPTYILKSQKALTVEEIKAVIPHEHKETMEETYDIYLLPPGEDPEACQSYLRMRNRDGKYNLMFEDLPTRKMIGGGYEKGFIYILSNFVAAVTGEIHSCHSKTGTVLDTCWVLVKLYQEWVTDIPFIISPRITFEVSVRLLGGLMALGYTIATILKRSSHVFSYDHISVKIDWLEQLNRRYVQVQGRDRLAVKEVAQKLGLDGSYIPRTYIEQIQLEKLVDEVLALPDDLKTKLSIDDDVASSPREALSRASADRVAMRKNLKSLPHSFSTRRDKNLANLTRLTVGTKPVEVRGLDSPAPLPNQGMITQLSEQISTLNERMDEFTSKIEELNAKLTANKSSTSQQNLSLQVEACNGSLPTSHYLSGYGNGGLHTSSSVPQFSKESPLLEEVAVVARGQRQIMHQLDNLSNFLHENTGQRNRQSRVEVSRGRTDVDLIGVPLIAMLLVGGISALLLRGYRSQ